MTKFHVNPKTGEAGVCRAKHKCLFGLSEQQHFASENAAREHFEQSMTDSTIVTNKAVRSRSDASPLPLADIMDVDSLKQMIDSIYVTVSEHPDDPSLKVLTYSHFAQANGVWNNVTKQTRGLILRSEKEDFSDAVVIERPWSKFFTLSQHSSGWALGDEDDGDLDAKESSVADIDFDSPAEITDKADGSLGILYDAPNGTLGLATKGSFASDQAIMYTELLNNDETLTANLSEIKKSNPDVTFLFELVGKDNPIVLKYDKNEMIYLGAVNKKTGEYLPFDAYAAQMENIGIRTTEVQPAKTLREAIALPDRTDKEGVVVLIHNSDPAKQMQFKIKQLDYLLAHKALSGMTDKKLTELLASGKTIQDVISVFPERFHQEFSDKCERILNVFDETKNKILEEYNELPKFSSRKDFAIFVQGKENSSFYFTLYDNKDISENVWKRVKNDLSVDISKA